MINKREYKFKYTECQIISAELDVCTLQHCFYSYSAYLEFKGVLYRSYGEKMYNITLCNLAQYLSPGFKPSFIYEAIKITHLWVMLYIGTYLWWFKNGVRPNSLTFGYNTSQCTPREYIITHFKREEP